MAIIEGQTVKVKWGARNKKHYEQLGYTFTKIGDEFTVSLNEVNKDSRGLINCRCDWCKKTFSRSVKSIVNKDNHFCSNGCRREWYSKYWSKQENWKLESQIRAVKILSDKKVGTDTLPQKIANKILDSLTMSYINEYNCKFVSIDNYLDEHDLMIEVMGTYWHTDPRLFKEIISKAQFERVKHDKRKRAIIKNNYSIDILYLWEKDLTDNELLCQLLIEEYVRNKGILKDYHSFNYSVTDDILYLNKKTISPYFDEDIEYIKEIFNPRKKDKDQKRFPEKWITFDCECCGEPTEQLKSRYNKNKTHTCSTECKKKLQQIDNTETLGIPYKCDCCNKDMIAKNYMYNDLLKGKRKSIFCSYECLWESRRLTFKSKNS
ncbi:hypothetical protein [Priestia aryabhattai]|uniref:hypothetical protein n=1 Tax=Priestia aryabhattai TaxID=412384 RepID=UPI0015F387E3|nr:hypothetical protein [Priestia aryabhattai]